MFAWIKDRLLLVMGVVVALLLIGLVSVGFYAHDRATKVGELESAITTVTKERDEANKSLQRQSDMKKAEEELAVKSIETKQENQTKAKDIKAKVDKAEVMKSNGQIDNTNYDTELSSSMWDAYCSAVPASASCTSRQPTNGLSDRATTTGVK